MRRSSPPLEKLTPREWEVLALVREGLTNEQIASKLGISRDGVKYHVSEILGKLAVADRIEAARWYDRETRQRTGIFGLFDGIFEGRDVSAANLVAAGGIVAAAVAFVALLAGVLIMQSRGPAQPEALPEDRRSGNERLDEVMLALLSDDAATLEQQANGTVAREYDSVARIETRYDDPEWIAMLTSAASRELYAVMQGHPQAAPPRDFEVYLKVIEADGTARSWQFAYDNYRLVDISINDEQEFRWLAESVGHRFSEFVVLPPAADRPQPPSAHDLTITTGDPGLDAVLESLERHDAPGLLARVAYKQQPCEGGSSLTCGGLPEGTMVEALAITGCSREPSHMSRAFVERRLTSMGGEALGIAGIVRLPEGYFPAGEAMVFVVGEESPYAWQTNAIVVAGGEITGVIDRCPPEMLYPPASFIVPPPADDSDDVDPARRSGVEVIDDFLGALAAEDMTALAGLVNYQRIGCVVEQLGIGAPPLCEPGEPDGTLIDALAVAGCEGHYARVQDMEDRILPQLVDANWALYAVLDLGDLPPGQDDWMRGQYQLVLQDPLRAEYQQSIAFNFDEAGMTIIRYSCGIGHPAVLFWPGRTPEWILAPP